MQQLSMKELKEFSGHLISDKWHYIRREFDMERRCPFNGAVIWSGTSAIKQEINLAFIAARQAFYCWKTTSREKRKEALLSLQQELEKRKEAFAEAISLETGKPLWESRQEVTAALAKLDHTLKAQSQRQGEQVSSTHELSFQPHGVIVVMGPFNFPLHISHGQICPALLAGNCVVFKPSPLAPLSARLYGEAIIASSLPKGAVNILFGEKESAQLVASHPQLDGLFFTGSSQVGEQLSEQFGRVPQKILALEMGGSNPIIVSDLSSSQEARKAAMQIILQSAFITTGQRCTCARRLILVRSTVDNLFLEELANLAKKLSIGPAFAKEPTFMGPLIDSAAQRNCIAFQKSLLSNGGYALAKAQIPTDMGLGNWITPAIIKISSHKMISDRECFGPILQVCHAGDLEEAIDIANETPFGLSCSIIGSKESQFTLAKERIRCGILNWNSPTTGASSHLPFGGVGASGNHRPAGSFMIDSCAYPLVSSLSPKIELAEKSTLPPGMQNLF